MSQNWHRKGGPGTQAVEGGTVALPKGNYGGSMMMERAAGASEGLCAPRTERAKCHPAPRAGGGHMVSFLYLYLCRCSTRPRRPVAVWSSSLLAVWPAVRICYRCRADHDPCRRPAAGRDAETPLDHNSPPLLSLQRELFLLRGQRIMRLICLSCHSVPRCACRLLHRLECATVARPASLAHSHAHGQTLLVESRAPTPSSAFDVFSLGR